MSPYIETAGDVGGLFVSGLNQAKRMMAISPSIAP